MCTCSVINLKVLKIFIIKFLFLILYQLLNVFAQNLILHKLPSTVTPKFDILVNSTPTFFNKKFNTENEIKLFQLEQATKIQERLTEKSLFIKNTCDKIILLV